jgi:hypothetical protein
MANFAQWMFETVRSHAVLNKLKIISPSLLPRQSSGGVKAIQDYIALVKSMQGSKKPFFDFYNLHIYPENRKYAKVFTIPKLKSNPTSAEYWIAMFNLAKDTIAKVSGIANPKIIVTETNFENEGNPAPKAKDYVMDAAASSAVQSAVAGVMKFASANLNGKIIWYDWNQNNISLSLFYYGSPAWLGCTSQSSIPSKINKKLPLVTKSTTKLGKAGKNAKAKAGKNTKPHSKKSSKKINVTNKA